MTLLQNLLSLKKEARDIAKLASPLIVTQLAQIAIMVTDVLMMGLLGTHDLAAGGLAIAIFSLLRTFGNGIISAISNLIAFEQGKKTASKEIGNIAKAGFIIAFVLGLIFYALSWGIKPVLVWTGQDNAIIPLTIDFLHIASFGIAPCLGFIVLRNFTIGLRHPGKLMIFTLISVVLNIVFNTILIFGYLGFPALGLMGIAWSGNIVFFSSFVMFAISIAKNPLYKQYEIFHNILACTFIDMLNVVKTGLPIAITYVAEAGFFTVIALLMGKISEVALAANVIVSQCVNITFMLAVGISQATSMCIGHAYGANDYYAIRRYAYSALILGFICMSSMGVIFWLFGSQIMLLFIRENTPLNTMVYTLGIQLLLVAAVFQIFDGWQNIAIGILRGFKAMNKSMFISLFGYWVIGLPLAYLLGFHTQQGAIGVWWGLAYALAITAILFIISFERTYRNRYLKYTTSIPCAEITT